MADTPIILLPGTGPAGWTRKAYTDPILSSGSLMLMDIAAEGGYDYGTTLPVDGNIIPNIAWRQAANILGSGDRTTLSSQFKQNLLVGNVSAKHKTEWTLKKGLHTMITRTPGIAATEHVRFTIPAPIAQYMYDQVTGLVGGHVLYGSIWSRLTRLHGTPAPSPQPFSTIASNVSPTSNAIWYVSPITGPTIITGASEHSVNLNTLSPGYSSFEMPNWRGTRPTSIPTNSLFFWVVGAYGGWGGLNLDSQPSNIFYRTYFEDLTVSGRTWAEVHAIDLALHTAAFASGGRFFGDTYSDPTVAAPPYVP